MGGCSLTLLNECVLCPNGHRFCLECLGQWALRALNLDNDDHYDDDVVYLAGTDLANPLTPAATTQSWLGLVESYFSFAFDRDPARMLSVRHTRLRQAAALPDIRSGPKTGRMKNIKL